MEGKPRYQAQPAVTATKDTNGKLIIEYVKEEVAENKETSK